jgi:hypothetical protein
LLAFLDRVDVATTSAFDDNWIFMQVHAYQFSEEEARAFWKATHHLMARAALLIRFPQLFKNPETVERRVMRKIIWEFRSEDSGELRLVFALVRLERHGDFSDLIRLREFKPRARSARLRLRVERAIETLATQLGLLESDDRVDFVHTGFGESFSLHLESKDLRAPISILVDNAAFLTKADVVDAIDLAWETLHPNVAIAIAVSDRPLYLPRYSERLTLPFELKDLLLRFCRARAAEALREQDPELATKEVVLFLKLYGNRSDREILANLQAL